MTKRIGFLAVWLLTAGAALAQTPPKPVPPPAPVAPAAAPAPPSAPAPPAPAAVPRKEGQPINIRVELAITETAPGTPPVKRTVVAVVGDGFSGYVREQAVVDTNSQPATALPMRTTAPLNLDAMPTILASGKIRLVCTIQYSSNHRPSQETRVNTEIRQNLVLILESGKTLTISEATDPIIPDRHINVEVTATILK